LGNEHAPRMVNGSGGFCTDSCIDGRGYVYGSLGLGHRER
jgi:hypothetical protein